MPSLFPDAPPPRRAVPAWLPPGFAYHRDFLTAEEEAELLAGIAGLELANSRYHEYTARRRTVGFGLRFSYDTGELSAAAPAPQFLADLAAKVAAHQGLDARLFPHVLVTEYPPGAPIGWHRDAPPFAAIYGVSLAGACDFRLRPYQLPSHRTGASQRPGGTSGAQSDIIHVPVEPRSLYVMQGTARSAWQHSIPPVKQTRYSITLRTLR